METEDAADRELVENYLRRREEASFLSLYRRHTPALFGLAVRLCAGERSDAEEILQEAWVRAAQALASFRWNSSLRTWLSGIVVNGWREHARARRRDVLLEDEPSTAGHEVPLAARIDLAQAVGDLPDGFRAVLVLHDVEGFTHEEIGRLLGIEAGTSKSQLARARETLRRRLGGCVA
jgi:RNA polymerase sigma-70 factor (ECF subfamily)